ncbi:MAG: DUF523 domain-containing protein, partial [Cocleimonas sp.]|nr:DUF523 domain-containing protein [Cocleimonas sp.]
MMTHCKPLFAISSCLIGEKVRYDGQSQAVSCHELILIKKSKRLLPLCPEMAIGLGMPRPAIQLRQTADGYHAVVIENPSLDYTQALRDYAATVLQRYPNLAGFILKQKSPSCGTGKTKLFDAKGSLQQEKGWGIFADELRRL